MVLVGARQTGKTTLAKQLYSTLRFLNLDDSELRASLRTLRTASWGKSVGPAVLDEAQKEPAVFEKVKHAFDGGEVDFTVLLGSSRILLLRQIRETLAGRAFLYDLWPLMLSELAAAPGGEPPRPMLADLLGGRAPAEDILADQPEILLGDEEERRRAALDHLGVWGGMPALLELSEDDRRMWLRSYQQTHLERDLIDLVQLSDFQPFRKLQELAMLRNGQILSYSKLARDAQISATTARRYLQFLDLSYQITLLQPFYRNLTSSVIKTPKLYWNDIGLLRHGIGYRGPLTGSLFEQLVVTECLKWMSTMASDAKLFYYRTRSGLEVDLLIQTPLGILGIEVKNRETASRTDARSLKSVAASLGDEWLGGLVVYRGGALRPLIAEERIWSVPAHRLF